MKRFASKRDFAVLAIVGLGLAAAGGAVALTSYASPTDFWLAIAATLGVALLTASIFASTYYEVDGNQLRVRCGPITWHIRISDITAITPTYTPLSGPALSFDKLQITYGYGKKLLISPADKAGFLAAIGWITTPSGCQKAAS